MNIKGSEGGKERRRDGGGREGERTGIGKGAAENYQ